MDARHDLPPVPTGQPSQPQVQEQPLASSSSQSRVQEQPPSSGQPQVQDQPSPSRLPRVQEEPSQSGGSSDSRGSQTHSSATQKPLLGSSDGYSPARDRNDPHPEFEPVPHIPADARSRDVSLMRGPSRRVTRGNSGLDWIVPVDEKPRRLTIGERLNPSIINAEKERAQYAIKAQWTGYALNIAIGLQVLLGALTTGLSAALSGRQVSIGTALLGGMSTMVASYLARARGSNEPELSITRVKDLDQFLRDCLAFKMDHGHEYGTPENGLNERLDNLRRRFEELLGNGDGQRKLSPPV
ncbi:hypothetical protein K503DRAFT_767508 [Rhizopogon vinicolor AM-OR11-026]|uniref:SMODS and SLOG-associating 2TM effector domain-containing protein n=1 Tax=Rhizopogon vinicolor AM-OR11-026 TaxID=1314800 RepID=A0A1B7NA04_9AGAM|nr:hypothetical protein K503DRAFT_767508 [Rhizopogon vinicolor AM-OR11-026]